MPKMTNARLFKLVEELDSLNTRACDIVKKIEGSDHPDAAAIAGELWDQCASIASAKQIVDDLCVMEG